MEKGEDLKENNFFLNQRKRSEETRSLGVMRCTSQSSFPLSSPVRQRSRTEEETSLHLSSSSSSSRDSPSFRPYKSPGNRLLAHHRSSHGGEEGLDAPSGAGEVSQRRSTVAISSSYDKASETSPRKHSTAASSSSLSPLQNDPSSSGERRRRDEGVEVVEEISERNLPMSFARQQREMKKAREGWMNAMSPQPPPRDSSSSSSPPVRPLASPSSPSQPREEDLGLRFSSSSSSAAAPMESRENLPPRALGGERGPGEGGRTRAGLIREEKKLQSLRSVRGVGELFDLTAHNLTNLVHATDDGYQASLATQSHRPLSFDAKKKVASTTPTEDEPTRSRRRAAGGGGEEEEESSLARFGNSAYRHCHTSDGSPKEEEGEEGDFSSNLRGSLHLSSSSSPEISYSHGASVGRRRTQEERAKKNTEDPESRACRAQEAEEPEAKDRTSAPRAIIPPSSSSSMNSHDISTQSSLSLPVSSSSSSSFAKREAGALGERCSLPRQHPHREDQAEAHLHRHHPRQEGDTDNAKEQGIADRLHHAPGPPRHTFARSSAYIGRDEARAAAAAVGFAAPGVDSSSSSGSPSPPSPSPRPKTSSSSSASLTNRTGGGRTREGEEGEMKSIRAVFQQMQKDRVQNSRITRARAGMKKDNSLRNAQPIRIFCGTWNSEYQEFPPGAMSSSPSSPSSSSVSSSSSSAAAAGGGATAGSKGVVVGDSSSHSASSLPPELPERLVEELLDDEDAWATGEMSASSPSFQEWSLSMKALPSDSVSSKSPQRGGLSSSSLRTNEREKSILPGDDLVKSVGEKRNATLDGGGVRTPEGHTSTQSTSSSSTTSPFPVSGSSSSCVVAKTSSAGSESSSARRGGAALSAGRSSGRGNSGGDRSTLSSASSPGGVVVQKERLKGSEENLSREREKEDRDASRRHISCDFTTGNSISISSSSSSGSHTSGGAKENVKMVARNSLMRASTLSLQNVEKGEQPLRDWILPGYDVYVITLQETISDSVFQTITAYLSQENRQPYRRMQAVEDRISGLGDGAWTQFKSTSIAAWAREDLLKPRGPVEFVSSKAIPLSTLSAFLLSQLMTCQRAQWNQI